jgi:isopenicillin N synthase-like dioxygenase
MRANHVAVIDVSRLLEDDAALTSMDTACREWGFFQIVGHGVPPALVAAFMGEMRRFFALPMAWKQEIRRTADNAWGFYDKELTKNTRDWKQILDIGPAVTEGPMAGSVPQWPAALTGFQNIIDQFNAECERVAHLLTAAISKNLGMPADFLRSAFGEAHTSFLRLNYYPVCDDPAPEHAATVTEGGQLGINRHTDAGAVTVLLQDDQPGLQVSHGDRWHTIHPRSDALVINIGDVVQVWSNDRYQAPLHRVLASSSRERFSAPYFFNPSYETDYGPLPSLTQNGVLPRYRPINWGEFRSGRAAGDYTDHGEEVQISHFRI